MAVTTTNLGVITAYGDAVAAGYTGTKAEWQALMASYATVGQQAVDAKNAAVAAKDTAVSKATEATTAANTATTKAGEASASAQSIAQSASQIQENTDDISQLKSELEVTSSYNIVWSQGGINNSGTAVSRTNRIRTDYIAIENDSIFVEIPSGFKYAIHAYNASKTRIGYIPDGSDIMTDRKATYKVSDSYDNAVYFRMWVAYADDSDILPAEGANVTVAPFESVIETLKSHVLKSVRILGVGNSYTRDSIRWLCNILKESGYEDVVAGHGYLGASTLAEQYASLDSSDSNHSAFEYWKYSNTKNATKTSGKTLDEIFVDEPWDIVVFQQQSDESGQYASYVSSSFDINDFITYISGKVSNPDLKFALMMPWSHADGYTSTKFAEYYNSDPKAMLDAIKTVIPQVADHMSQCDYVVNAGEAIDLGRQNSYLNALGDQMLRTDKNHLYYGIPSYMVGLVYALTLCDVNLNNVMWYPTATDERQTGITTSGYLAYLAKQCAFTAVNGYALADDISELKEDLNAKADTVDMLKAFPTDTASGSVASFADGANVPVKSLIVNIDPVQGGKGNPSPTNAKPISGWTGAKITKYEKNMFNTDNYVEMGLYSDSGDTYFIAGRWMLFSAVEEGKTYTISRSEGGTSTYYYYGIYDKPPVVTNIPPINRQSYGVIPSNEFSVTIPTNGKYLAVFYGAGKSVNPQLEEGSVATTYDDSAETVSVDWTSEAGTIYGGTLDVTKGELVIDRAMVEINGSDLYVTTNASNYHNVLPTGYIDSTNKNAKWLTNMGAVDDVVAGVNGANKFIYLTNSFYSAIGGTDEVANAFFGTNHLQVVYELATPLTIQLTPHEVTALLGSNNIWADTGDTAVEYRADPTLYIQRLTEPDADMVADANITSGSYFMVGNTLYKATANIASGATISPNVNCTRKSLSEALNELNV